MSEAKPYTLPFTQIQAADLPLVGGKGANLGEMTRAGFPIPPGFCVTTVAFAQFTAAYPEIEALYARLDQVTTADLEGARQTGLAVREALLGVAVPADLATAILDQWRALDPHQAYAVRSSATAEDLPDASFAGQQDTYLNVIGETALLDAVHRCWVSLFTDRAILYRIQNGFAHRDVQLSVVVQQMVMSETSGILFTADPLTGHRHTATIDASFGLGEALVSGVVSPDAYQVDKRSLTITARQIADKRVAIYPQKGGGIQQVDLSPGEREQPVLNDAQIVELATLGTRVEAHYGTPQDIEWAIVGEKLFLLQTRPITSLYPIDGLPSADGTLNIFYSIGHQQMMTNAMAPLSLSTMRAAVPLGRKGQEIESPIVNTSGGRVFGNITQLLHRPLLRRVLFTVSSQFDALAPQTMALAMQRPEFVRRHKTSIPFKLVFSGLRIGSRVMAALWWQDNTGIVDRANTIVAETTDQLRAQLAELPTNEARLKAIAAGMSSLIHPALFWIPKFIASEIAKRLVARLMRHSADPADLDAYTLGLSGNAVTDMNLAVGDLAEIARQTPRLAAHFASLNADSQLWLQQAANIDGSDRFFAAWHTFIEQYGARGSAEIDLQSARWYEEPLPLLQVIASYLQQEAGSHRQQHHALVVARKQAIARLQTQARKGPLGWLRGRLLNRLLHVVAEGSVLREHHKFLIIRQFRVIKETIKAAANQLTAAGQLLQPDDIWYLTWPELIALFEGRLTDTRATIETRRAAQRRYQGLTPPMIITSDGETPVARYHVDDAPPGALVGNPVSAGVVEGRVRVIHDPRQETIEPGDILVAAFTDPGWTPLFINAGGLITEIGGAMTHGSVVAREYGIPAVVGVRAATTQLQSGQAVRVDGNRGVIERI